jgi:hypothetical protein
LEISPKKILTIIASLFIGTSLFAACAMDISMGGNKFISDGSAGSQFYGFNAAIVDINATTTLTKNHSGKVLLIDSSLGSVNIIVDSHSDTEVGFNVLLVVKNFSNDINITSANGANLHSQSSYFSMDGNWSQASILEAETDSFVVIGQLR